MSSPTSSSRSVVPEAARNLAHSPSPGLGELEWTTELDAAVPPYTRYEALPPYPVPCKEIQELDESKQQQELQMLLGALLSFVATLLLVELPPKMGEPTSVLHGIRMYGWFVMAVVFCMLLVAVSSLCKWWLTVNGSDRNPKTKFQVFKKYAVERLVASGPILLRSCFACIAVGLVDFLWQLYPSLGKNVVATCGIYGSGPILSSVGQRPLTKTMASFARRCLFTRAGNEDLARSSEEESLEH